MGMLGKPNWGYEALLILAYKHLLEKGECTKNEILDACCPDQLITNSELMSRTLMCWINLGLFKEKKKKISITKDLMESDLSLLPNVLRKVIFDSKNVGDDLWEYNNNNEPDVSTFGSTDFVASLSFCLASNIYTLPINTCPEFQRSESTAFSDFQYRLFRNDTRYPSFKDWFVYLGFGINLSNGVTIDPTEAIKQELPELFKKKKELDHIDFLKILAGLMPVFDEGTYRNKLEKRLNSETWRETKKTEISQSLSRALLNLEHMNYVELVDNADYPKGKRSLLGRNYSEIKSFSHIKIKH